VSSALVIVVWILFTVGMIMLFITSTKLIYRLREQYPDVYASVGRPRAFSRSVNFLWRLKPYESQLSPADVKLLRVNLALVYICSAAAVAFVIYVVSQSSIPPRR
jgi:hypothetical protein